MVTIAIIGIDGSGKTTQAKLLSDRLKLDGYNCIYVQPVMMFINRLSILTRKKFEIMSPRRSQTKQNNSIFIKPIRATKKLFIAAVGFFYSLCSIIFIKYWLGKNKVVVCDRFFYQFLF